MNTDLIKRLRDAVHYAYDVGTPDWSGLIAEADAHLTSGGWVRVEDALPVITDNEISVDVWFWFAGKKPYRWPFSRYADMLDSRVTHWQYNRTPNPPEQTK